MSVKTKQKILSKDVTDILRCDIPLREKIAKQLGIDQRTVYMYATRASRYKALTKYPIVIEILKKHTGLTVSQILISKN